jgi:DNA-binding MarR family transcriptional regulator
MATITRKEVAPAPAGGDQEQLLLQAVRQMLAMRNVMRLAVKELHSKHPFPEHTRLGEGQFRALHVLCEDGAMTVGNLAEQCHVADPTISKMLRSLEQGGWLVRQIDPENRRLVWVSVTPAGRELYARFQAQFESALAKVLSPLTPEQLRDIIKAFRHLETLTGEAGGPG